ncbi:MAG: DUF2515 family protein [Roseiflexaceae bacterium]
MNRNSSPQPTNSQPAQNPRQAWQARADQRIALDEGNLGEHMIVFKRNQAITAAYAEMYLRNPQLYKWAGMAALTSATVGRGMYIMYGIRQAHLGSVVGLFGREVAETFRQLGVGNRAVFTDIYWQHMAYDQGGLAELEQIGRSGELDERALHGWRLIDAGRRAGDQDLVWAGNTVLLHYEQKEVLQPQVYDHNPALWHEVSGWIPSPIPGHREVFGDFARGGNIGVFRERWSWIEGHMLPRWRDLADGQPARAKRLLQSLMLGGEPLTLPGLPALKMRLGVYQAVGLRNGFGAWLPKAPAYSHA